MRTDDDRQLCFAIWGDPDGAPLLYCHGWPGSRWAGSSLHASAAELGVCLIVPDRPGMGRSDFQRRRTLRDWPADLTALADSLGLQSFPILGYSGGGAYALAAAARLPNRISAVALVSSMGPADHPVVRAALPVPVRAAFAAVRRSPRLLEPLLTALSRALESAPARLARAAVAVGAGGPAPLSEPALFNAYRDELREAFCGGARGVAHDAWINAQPWPFSLADIEQPVSLFHGERDQNVPRAVAHALADSLPRCTAQFIPDAGHFWIHDHLAQVIAALAAH